MAQSFIEFLRMSRDIARCLNDSNRLAFPVPLEDGILPLAQKIVEGAVGKTYPIEVTCRDSNSSEARSLLIRWNDKAEIRYSRTLNLCWRRFSVCKELSHLLYDTADACTTDYAAMAPLLVANTIVPEWITTKTATPFFSELVCGYGAVELLLPWPIRGQLVKMSEAGSSDLEIATYCKVPQIWITIALKSPWSEISRKLNEEYDQSIGQDWAAGSLPPAGAGPT